MAKEYYEVSYKTYLNDRIYPVLFKGKETCPLYVRVTYDRKTVFFKSYLFELLSMPKYDGWKTSLAQIEEMEGRFIEYLIAMNIKSFDLDTLTREYKIWGFDILDRLEGPFRVWLAGVLREEKLPGLAMLIEQEPGAVAVIRIWDDLKKSLNADLFNRIEEKAVRVAPPYMLLATYVRHQYPEGPFCLPFHEWAVEEKRIEMEDFLDKVFWRMDMGQVIRQVWALYPNRRKWF
jgi:hypothetical protein